MGEKEMEWIEYKLERGAIAVTPCPEKRKKMDGTFKMVGSTACMLCVANRGQTFYEDGSGGMVKCDVAKHCVTKVKKGGKSVARKGIAEAKKRVKKSGRTKRKKSKEV